MSKKKGSTKKGNKNTEPQVENPEIEDNAENATKKRKIATPTVTEIIGDKLTFLSLQYWAPLGDEVDDIKRHAFDASIIEKIYEEEIKKQDLNRIMLLEVSHYLENYLWKNFDSSKSSLAHLLSIIFMVNEKFRENVTAWECFHSREKDFPAFFERILSIDRTKLSFPEKSAYLVFITNCFQSLEDEMVRKECVKLVSFPIWFSLHPERLKKELKLVPKLAKRWSTIVEEDKSGKKKISEHEKHFIFKLMEEFLDILASIDDATEDKGEIRYCERFIELMIDLESQIPTRKFFHALLQNSVLVVRCRLSKLFQSRKGKLFFQLVEMLRFYEGFEVDPFTGKSITDEEAAAAHSKKIQELQKIAFAHFQPELKNFALSNIASLSNAEGLLFHLNQLSSSQLKKFAQALGLLAINEKKSDSREFLLEVIVAAYEQRVSQLQSINEMPLYPTEDLLWDPDIIPSDEFANEHPLSLPKLNLQFLSVYDYLLRNYDLFRLESSYEIRGDIEDSVRRVQPRKSVDPPFPTIFSGWSRMALPIKDFKITQVSKPRLGDNFPAEVYAEIQYSLSQFKGQIRQEWDSIKMHDVLFLVSFKPPIYSDEKPNPDLPFVEQFGLTFVRGCEVRELLDEQGVLIKDTEEETSPKTGDIRTLRVTVDPSQYQRDMDTQDVDVYATFNLIIRRKPQENNFKAVLETIRELMNSQINLPDWLSDIVLGYGDPSASKSEHRIETLDFVDTFVSARHLEASFQNQGIEFVDHHGKAQKETAELQPPFKITFPKKEKGHLLVKQYKPIPQSPYPSQIVKKNQIPFTPVQVEAIVQGMNEGLTMIVGPPGTGKTDVAVQIINNLYHNFPDQKTLLITHSNQALNQLFEKIIALDIDERYVVRLGHGEDLLETSKDFSKYGRVNFMLEKRLQLLEEADRLAKSLFIVEDVAYTCETSEYFFSQHVLAKWDSFLATSKLQSNKSPEWVANHFPFSKFFANAPQPLFHGKSFEEDMETSRVCFRYIEKLFEDIKECRAFELLKNTVDRGNYLVTRQCKIIAMTCTHAALKRSELVSLGFRYDNVIMEEAAQILELETFIPFMLQSDQDASRLKRVTLIGDHNQLPPIVKNLAFQKFSHMDQSMFARFVRLGVPTITLDAQGRSRPSISALYNWRYKGLKNLPIVSKGEFTLANPGFELDYQVIDVPDFDGKGESTPAPYFYQNLGEAEYVVATFMYMRHLGYPANKISILTTYNGQKALIRDVLQTRCGWNPFYGSPHKITTVDKYQGQQNDYILLSLVRTKAVGHLRDIRRLVVAMSRARLGLYIFCRKSLFENTYELSQTFGLLRKRPNKLQLVENERYPNTSRKIGDHVKSFEVEGVLHLGKIVHAMQQDLLKSSSMEVSESSQSHQKESPKQSQEKQEVEVASKEPAVEEKKAEEKKEETKEEAKEDEAEDVEMEEIEVKKSTKKKPGKKAASAASKKGSPKESAKKETPKRETPTRKAPKRKAKKGSDDDDD